MKEETEETQETQDSSENEDTEEDNGQRTEPSETMPRETPSKSSDVQYSVPDTSSETVQQVTQEQLQAYILSKLLEGSSYRELSQQVGIPKSTLQKYYPKSYIDNVRLSLQRQQEEKVRSQQAQSPMQQPPPQQPIYQEPLDQSALPHGSIVLTPQMIGNIRSGLNATQQRHFDMAMNIASQYQDQVLARSQTRGQPFPQGSVEQEEAGLLRAMARHVRFRTYQDLTTDNPRKNPGSTEVALKQAADFIKFGASLVSPNKQQDSLGIYRTGREDAKGELSRLGKSGETNSLDLRLEELRQSHDIDMQKISFEQKKFFLGLQNERDKWDKITEVFGPVISAAGPEIKNAIRELGKGIGASMGGAAKPKQNVNVVPTKCPKCGSDLNIPVPEGAHDLVNVKCPKCGNLFQLEEEKEPEPELRPKAKGRLGSRYT